MDKRPCGTGPQTSKHILQCCPTNSALRCQTWQQETRAEGEAVGLPPKLWTPSGWEGFRFRWHNHRDSNAEDSNTPPLNSTSWVLTTTATPPLNYLSSTQWWRPADSCCELRLWRQPAENCAVCLGCQWLKSGQKCWWALCTGWTVVLARPAETAAQMKGQHWSQGQGVYHSVANKVTDTDGHVTKFTTLSSIEFQNTGHKVMVSLSQIYKIMTAGSQTCTLSQIKSNKCYTKGHTCSGTHTQKKSKTLLHTVNCFDHKVE